jgi:hypothetical protein
MPAEYQDLRELLEEILITVPDSRSVWCTAALHFETTITRRRGLLLGGAWTPQLLRDGEELWPVPWTMALPQPRVLTVERATGPFWKWLPLLESVAKAGESLVVATDEVSDDFLRTLIANLERRAIKACAIRSSATAFFLAGERTDLPGDLRSLLQVKEAWIRKDASVLFPWNESDWPAGDEIAVVEIGGEDCEDQRARLRFFAEALRKEGRSGSRFHLGACTGEKAEGPKGQQGLQGH